MMKLEIVWNEYRAALKAFLHARISDSDDVDDLLQEILIRTHNSIDTLKSEQSLKSWLFSIANNVIIDFYRSRARRQGREQQLAADQLWYSEEPTPEYRNELQNCLTPFIHALPETTSELLTAVDLQGQSQKALAAEQGISYSTLKSRVQKGRQELRGLFEQCCSFEMDKQGNLIGCEQKQGCKSC